MMASRSIFTSFLLLYVLFISKVLTQECISPLGMANRRIKDSQITVSSFIKTAYGWQARLRQNIPDWGAWCANMSRGKTTEKNYDQYIEIDLLNLTKITRIATQGRQYNGGTEHVKDYKLSYRKDGGLWHSYKEKGQTVDKIFPGNTNVYGVMQHDLDPTIMARYIRVYPGYYTGQQACLRLELYGCVVEINEKVMLSYSIPVGQTTRNGKVMYADLSYSGVIDEGIRKGGTGILTDGKFGPVNAKELKGEGWVGWNTAFTQSQYIDIIFEFTGVRKFKNVTLTVNVDKKRDHPVFNRSQIFFSSTENSFSDTSFLQYCPKDFPAKTDPYNAHVTLSLCENTARFIKLRLYFGGQWLLITEISFNSVSVSDDETVKDCSGDMAAACTATQLSTGSLATTPVPGCKDCTTLSTYDTDVKVPAKTSSGSSNLQLTIVIVCVILLIVIVLLVVIFLLYRRRALCFGKMTQRNKTPLRVELHRVESLQTGDMQNERSQEPEAIQNSQEADYNAADNAAYEVDDCEATEVYEEIQISPPSVNAQLERNLKNETEDENYQKWLKSDPNYVIPADTNAEYEKVGKIQSFLGYTELDNAKRVHDDSAFYKKLEPDYNAAGNGPKPYEEVQTSPPPVYAQLDKNRLNKTDEDTYQKLLKSDLDYVMPADTDAEYEKVGKSKSAPGYTELDNTKRVHDDSAFYQKLIKK